ncbi:Mu-like prophage I protein-like [Pelobacter propionicus]|uniref:Mu-like prophage I protein-like protein n=1 Tax=Pelobacter propionicus (strain DSM 2379 / NBRC 103807 / OttBd1) TaxID=338966 RepID=A1ARM8_PELPD|nr:Mu-like prophage I protein-like [Pelobacter propionicus]ABK99998.1 Mu-like prophage I protein-like protein [Pelobacter propionicus DSM 2379]
MDLLNQDYTLELNRDATGKAPTEIELIPREGQIIGRDGRSWLNDQPRTIISYFDQNGVKLPIDLEHSTHQKAPNGDPAPAVGWILKLYQNPYGAVWGTVEWNNQGRELIESKIYRYISPVFTYDRSTMSIVKLVSAGLTNRPNLFLQALNRVDTSLPHYPFAANSVYSPPVPAPHTLSAQDTKICNMMGIDPHAYIQANADNLSRPPLVAANSYEPPSAHGLGREELKIIEKMGLDVHEYIAANASRATSYAPISVNSQRPGASMGLSNDELRVCKLTGVSPLDYLVTAAREQSTGLNRQNKNLEALEAQIAELMGIPLHDIQKRKDQVTKRGAAMDAVSEKLSDEEIEICWAMGISPSDYKKKKSEAILNQL